MKHFFMTRNKHRGYDLPFIGGAQIQKVKFRNGPLGLNVNDSFKKARFSLINIQVGSTRNTEGCHNKQER